MAGQSRAVALPPLFSWKISSNGEFFFSKWGGEENKNKNLVFLSCQISKNLK
jgi:hypothetical protein